MEKNSDKEQFNRIDGKNLFSQWHPDVRKFTSNIVQNCAFSIIENTNESTFDITEYEKVLNFTNTKQCQVILDRILKENSTSNFFKLLKERDNLYPRSISRRYSIEEIFQLVKQDNYHPLLFLELNKKFYIIDGRTRFYCCLFLNVPARVRIISDNELNRKCSIIS